MLYDYIVISIGYTLLLHGTVIAYVIHVI